MKNYGLYIKGVVEDLSKAEVEDLICVKFSEKTNIYSFEGPIKDNVFELQRALIGQELCEEFSEYAGKKYEGKYSGCFNMIYEPQEQYQLEMTLDGLIKNEVSKLNINIYLLKVKVKDLVIYEKDGNKKEFEKGIIPITCEKFMSFEYTRTPGNKALLGGDKNVS
jgi:hypothetical protein